MNGKQKGNIQPFSNKTWPNDFPKSHKKLLKHDTFFKVKVLFFTVYVCTSKGNVNY